MSSGLSSICMLISASVNFTLAYDAGFKSKSSFNRYFKDITVYTPTDYYKGLQGDVIIAGYNV